jgi:hypothetical protein
VRPATFVSGAALLTAAVSASAHHSFAAAYDEGATIKIEGELVEFLFRNPHASVQIVAPDHDGQMQRWDVEWGGAGMLAGQGVTRDSLRAGDRVVITGNPSRNAAEHRLRLRSLLRPLDGFGWGQHGETFD